MATPVRLSPASENDFTEIYVYSAQPFGLRLASVNDTTSGWHKGAIRLLDAPYLSPRT